MTIDTLTEYTGTVPDKDNQARNVFQGACDDFLDYQLNTLVPELNTAVGQINTATTGITASEANVTDLELAAEEARDFASAWATSDVGVEVDDGVNTPGESSYAWAQRTMQGERFTATSTTSNSIATGSKTFVLSEGSRSFAAGSAVTIAYSSVPSTNYMTGVVTSYTPSTNTLVVNVTEIAGSGTFTSWSIAFRVAGSAATVGGRTADYLLDNRNHSASGATEGQIMRLSSGGTWAAGNTFVYETRTSNTILGAADVNKLIEITSGTFTQTFSAVSTLGSPWVIIIYNSGTGDVTLDPNSSETIDGLTSFVMYPGEARRIWSNGTNLRSMVVKSFYKQFTASGTFIKPPGYTSFKGYLWSAGASGSRYATLSNTPGGGGGGCFPFDLKSSILSTSESVVIGSGGAKRTTDGNGNTGGQSSFAGIIVSGGTFYSGGCENTIVYATSPDGFAGASFALYEAGHSVYGGAACYVSSGLSSTGKSVYGGGAGGCIDSTGATTAAGTSKFGGSGGTFGTGGTNGSDGVAPGGGGGGYTNGSGQSGAGARGQLDIQGVI